MLPINTADFSATLIKAKAYKPNVLLNNMGGLAQINCMKQFTQFGMQKDMALGGALFELESIKAVPDGRADRLVGHGMVVEPAQRARSRVKFVADFRKRDREDAVGARTGSAMSSVHSVRLGAEKAKSLEGPKLAQAMEDLELPPEVALAARQGASTAPATTS